MVPRNIPTGFRLTPVGCQGKLSCCSSTQTPTLLAAPVPAPSLQMPTPSPGLPQPCSTAPPPSARSLPPEAAAPPNAAAPLAAVVLGARGAGACAAPAPAERNDSASAGARLAAGIDSYTSPAPRQCRYDVLIQERSDP